MEISRSLSIDKFLDSGYATTNNTQTLPAVYFSPPHLKYINSKLKELEPEGKLLEGRGYIYQLSI